MQEDEDRQDSTLDIQAAGLTQAQRQELLTLARTTIDAFLTTGELPVFISSDPVLQRCAGVFVTIRSKPEAGEPSAHDTLEALGRLRGCIGHVAADLPLFQVAPEMAVAAAIHDFRFAPLTAGELPHVSLEISILSPMRPVADLEEIEIGRDGLLISGGGRRGLLLPQVPVAMGWDRLQFVQNLCRKAGLPADYWQKGQATLYSFTTLAFSEEQ
ncbi:MAG: AmmeMemoRadiSam system protein A [Chloroflexota bacterium]